MLIHTRKDLLREIEALLKPKDGYSISKIDFICPNFNYFNYLYAKTQNDNIPPKNIDIFKKIIQELKSLQNKNTSVEITIHTFNEIDQNMNLAVLEKQKYIRYLESFGDQLVSHSPKGKNCITINSYHYTDNPLIKLIQQFKNQTNNKNVETLKDLFESLDKDKLRNANFQSLKEYMKNYINNIDESKLFTEKIKPYLNDSFKHSLESLIEHIKKLLENKDNDTWKIAIKLVFDVAINIPLLSNPYSLAIGIVGIGASVALFMDEFNELQNRDYQHLLTPLANLLATEFGMFIGYANTHLLTCALIINKKEILDISSFNIDVMAHSSCIKSNLAYKASIPNGEIDIEKFFLQSHDQSNSFKLFNNTFDSTLYLNHKASNSIYPILSKSIVGFNHISYIESPYFNSAKLAESFANKENKTITNMGKNYLIITNAPSKHNAKLTEVINETIANNHIQDKHRNEIGFTYNERQNTYNSSRDYSNYAIQIEADNDKPFILQLSPFVKITRNKYNEFKESYTKLLELNTQLDEAQSKWNILHITHSDNKGIKNDINKLYTANDNIYNYRYINQFFKNNEDKKSIIEKEKELTKEYLTMLQDFSQNIFNNINNMANKQQLKTSDISIMFLKVALSLHHTKKLFPHITIITDKGVCVINYLDTKYEIKCRYLEGYNNIFVKIYDYLQSNTNIPVDEIKTSQFFQDLEKQIDNQESLEYPKKIELNGKVKTINNFDEELTFLYGDEYLKDRYQYKIEEIVTISFYNILACTCPFINFALDDNYIKIMERIIKFMVTQATQGLDQAILDMLGVFHLTKQKFFPDESYVELNNNKKSIKEGGEKIKQTTKDYAITELRLTKKQLAHFEAKSAIITGIKQKLDNQKELNLSNLKSSIKQHLKAKGSINAIDEKFIDRMYFYYDGSKPHQSYLVGKNQILKIIADAKNLTYTKIIKEVKSNMAQMAREAVFVIALELIFPSNYDAIKQQYDNLIYRFYTFKYDAPYALIKDDFVTYPMVVNARFMSFDLKKLFYGINLCTGVFHNHLSFHYELDAKSEESHHFALKRLLGYLIIDEMRSEKRDSANLISDEVFFNDDFTISLDNILKYQVPKESSLYRKFKDLERKGVASAIDAYNEAISILADYADYYFTHTRKVNDKGIMLSYKEDKNKARRFLECLNTIGQNNIRALYVGINDKENLNNPSPTPHIVGTDVGEDKNKEKCPKLIGRLATTIIIEDGLWLG